MLVRFLLRNVPLVLLPLMQEDEDEEELAARATALQRFAFALSPGHACHFHHLLSFCRIKGMNNEERGESGTGEERQTG